MSTQHAMEAPKSKIQEHKACATQSINVGANERYLSIGAGALLAVAAFSQMRVRVLVLAALGGALAYRGLTGHCQLYEELGMSTACCDDKNG